MDFLGPFRTFGYYIGICDAPITEEDEHTRKTREAYEALKKEVHRIESEKHKKKEKPSKSPARSLEEKTKVEFKTKAQESILVDCVKTGEKNPLQEKIAERRNKIIKKDY